MKVLVTGGPVYAKLDAVKILTNRFKGGLTAALADDLAAAGCEVTYLTSKDAARPKNPEVKVLLQDGFDEYMEMVPRLAAEHKAALLGAAVANLIPAKPYKGKFPSHDYKEGEMIPIDFMVAPRVIDRVRAAAPKTNLIGFKLLAGVSEAELARAAREVLRGSKANAVVANDASDLMRKRIFTPDGAVFESAQARLARDLMPMLSDEFYSTEFVEGAGLTAQDLEALAKFARFVESERGEGFFPRQDDGARFGAVATRMGRGFAVSGRGKDELSDFAKVESVDRGALKVLCSGSRKAALNAPLLARLFENNPQATTIEHGHVQLPGLPTEPHALPGSVRDADRAREGSFNIEGHGCFVLRDREGKIL